MSFLSMPTRALPFAAEFFDAILSIDSFVYYGTDDLYLSYLARFLRPGGRLGIAGAGLMHEMDGPVPEHLRKWWTAELCCLHSADWWRRHWSRSGVVEIELADSMPDGWELWLEWQKVIAPDNRLEIEAIQADRGKKLGYIRALTRRKDVNLQDPLVSIPAQYTKKPLLRGE